MASLIRPKRKQAPDYWVIQDCNGGQRRYLTLGRMSRSQAEERLRMFEARKLLGLHQWDEHDATGISFDAVIADIYLPLLRRKAAKTQEVELRSLGHIRRHWPGIKLAEVSPARIEEYKTARLDENARTRTINLELTALRNVLKAAEIYGLLPDGAPKVRALRIRDARPSVYLTLPQARRLQEALIGLSRKGGRYYPGAMASLLGLHSGMRKGEILTREVQDIDWSIGKHGAIRVAGKTSIAWSPKTGRERTVPMTELLAAEMKRFLTWRGDEPGWLFRLGAQGFLYRVADESRKLAMDKPMSIVEIASRITHLQHLCHRDEPWRYSVAHAIQRHRGMFIDAGHGLWQGRLDYEAPIPTRMKDFGGTLKASCWKAGVHVIHPHALRHTWATLAFSAGIDVRAVQELGGWRSPELPLRIYAHVSTQHAREAMRRFPLGSGLPADERL